MTLVEFSVGETTAYDPTKIQSSFIAYPIKLIFSTLEATNFENINFIEFILYWIQEAFFKNNDKEVTEAWSENTWCAILNDVIVAESWNAVGVRIPHISFHLISNEDI